MKLVLRMLFNILMTGLLMALMLWVTTLVLVSITGYGPIDEGPIRWLFLSLITVAAGAIPAFALARGYQAPSFYLGAILGAAIWAQSNGSLVLMVPASLGAILGHQFGLHVQRRLNPTPKRPPPERIPKP